ncbi:MAG: phospho-sugar mutase [Bacilli bacterium]|nr:phospho-sugar mutase [Bacilli bacterium]
MDKNILEKYNEWLNSNELSLEEKEELSALSGNKKEIAERFSTDLEFGTGGLRGIMALGTNRMNKYVIRHATQGLANYLLNQKNQPSVAIGHDSRNHSREYAIEAAIVLASNGIKAYIYKELMPTPALSFAVRYLKCDAGIVVTASHNPKMYNGYKCYGSDGCQMTDTSANAVFAEIQKIGMFDVKHDSEQSLRDKGLIETISDEVFEAYITSDLKQSAISEKASSRILNLAYTPLNGAGYKCVTTILNKDGFKHIDVVPEQKDPDGNFPTAPYPNPEMKEALTLGIKLLIEKNDDILIATDPDSDRIGVVVNQNGQPIILTGNEVGILLFDFIYKVRKEQKTLPANPFAVKTIVSSDMVNVMAKEYNVEIAEVLTGFKYIGEQILWLEQKGDEDRYIFGFEESCGYLTNKDVRDKDAVNATLLVAEMANYYKHESKTLYDKLQELYKKFGDYKTATVSYEFQGLEGKEHIKQLMIDFRGQKIKEVLGNVDHVGDYLEQKIYFNDHEEPTNLPKSNVVKFFLKGGETITIRPSGTEPKLKAYVFALGQDNLEKYKKLIDEFIGK